MTKTLQSQGAAIYHIHWSTTALYKLHSTDLYKIKVNEVCITKQPIWAAYFPIHWFFVKPLVALTVELSVDSLYTQRRFVVGVWRLSYFSHAQYVETSFKACKDCRNNECRPQRKEVSFKMNSVTKTNNPWRNIEKAKSHYRSTNSSPWQHVRFHGGSTNSNSR